MKGIKKNSIKILSLILCAVLAGGTVGAISFAAGTKKESAAEKETEEDGGNNAVSNISEEAGNAQDGEISKDETVYVISDAKGAPKKIIVSDWIQNKIGEDTYSQDEMEKSLPVELSVSYKLNGKEISPEELAGKSGKVTMRFDYVNNQYKEVEIQGEKQKVYVPFVMLTGMIVDNESFKNVEISNGRLINDGNHTVIIGFAMPGLEESLKIETEKLELPDYVEITADVTDFELMTTLTMATNEMFNDVNVEDVDTLDELHESLGKLTDAMDQLMDGSSALYDGLTTLLDKSGDLILGIDKLAAGADRLKSGAGSLSDGAKSLDSGAGQLSAGLNQLAANNDTLNGGAKQVFDSLLQTANAQLAAAGLTVPALTIDNYGEVLKGVMGSLDESAVRELAYNKALETVTAKVRENTVAISTQVEAAVKEQVIASVLAAAGNPMSEEQYKAIMGGAQVDEATQAAAAQISAAVDAQMASDGIRGTISQTTEAKIQELIAQNMQSSEVASQINAAVESAKSGATSIAALKTQLDSYNQFYQGLLTYTAGVASAKIGAAQLAGGASQISDGASSLYEGAGSLADGIGELKNGSGALTDGVSQLKDGAMKLSDGLKEFNEEGIEKLVDAVDGNTEALIDRVRAVVDVSKEYKSFAEIPESMSGSVKFIYKTDSIEKD